jgi:hypothetical protein
LAYNLNSDGSLTITGADPTAATDSSQAIQSAIDWLYNQYGGGKLWFPQPGNYYAHDLIGRGAVKMLGHGRGCTMLQCQNLDRPVLTLDATGNYGGFADLFVCGYTNAAAVNNAVSVMDNVPVEIENSNIWGGNSALFTKGVDGRYRNLFVSGWGFANIVSNGANWFDNVKSDTGGNSPMWGFYQGTPVFAGTKENTFSLCDFSGEFSRGSIGIYDGGTHTAFTRMLGCITSAPVLLGQAEHTEFTNHRFGSSVLSRGPGTLGIAGSYASPAISGLGASGAVLSGNTGIS